MSVSRRTFLAQSSALGAWVAAAVACRKEAAPDTPAHAPPRDTGTAAAWPPPLVNFTPEQAADLSAIAARIIPSDETPGATEAGVVYFIDRFIALPEIDQKKDFIDGLNKLAKDVQRSHGARFSALAAAQQDDILRAMEQTDFFDTVRFATICGMFALPKYGGNHDYVGWSLIGQVTGYEFTPPFGWYDRPENQRALLGKVL